MLHLVKELSGGIHRTGEDSISGIVMSLGGAAVKLASYQSVASSFALVTKPVDESLDFSKMKTFRAFQICHKTQGKALLDSKLMSLRSRLISKANWSNIGDGTGYLYKVYYEN